MKKREHTIIVPTPRNDKSSTHEESFPSLHLDDIQHPSLTLCKLRDLFRRSTGLDLFLFFQTQALGKWKEESLSDRIQLPRYCTMIRNHPIGLARCIASHQTMQRKAIECNRPVCQRCHAGLTTVHFPILLSGKGHADLQTVCALPHGRRSDSPRSLYHKVSDLDISESELQQALNDLQIISKSKANQVIDWLECITDYLSEVSYHRSSLMTPSNHGDFTQEKPTIEQQIRWEIGSSIPIPAWRSQRSTGATAELVKQVQTFIDRHYDMALSTQVMAQALGFEISYFAKIFTQYAHVSFTTYLKRVRLKRAQKLLKDPYLSISEIAQRTGFSDASYFTRVFRNTYGMTPTHFREISHLEFCTM